MASSHLEPFDDFQQASAQTVVDWALDVFQGHIAYACSFGAEGMVLIDMVARHPRRPRIITIDTGRLPPETHDLIHVVRERYRLEVEVVVPDTSAVQELMTERGPNSFYRSVEDRKECCRIRKVEPLDRALRGMDAWMTGLRRDQTAERAHLRKIECDRQRDGVLKIMPIVDWSWQDVWRYLRRNDVPYSTLHDEGYRSIGCAPCTRAVGANEDDRAGRWWWEEDTVKECGLHLLASHTRNSVTGAIG